MIILFLFAAFIYLLNVAAGAPKILTLDALKIVDVSQECQYTLHNGERDAPLIKGIVGVGQEIYHKITCTPPTRLADTKYCLLLFNCTISNKLGTQKYLLIDENGCSLETFIIEHVEYPEDLEAGIRAQAVRFIDDPDPSAKSYLQCQARFLPKGSSGSGDCDSRRPVCRSTEYRKYEE